MNKDICREIADYLDSGDKAITEIENLFGSHVAECPECKKEFAAASMLQAIPEITVKEHEINSLQQVAANALNAREMPSRGVWQKLIDFPGTVLEMKFAAGFAAALIISLVTALLFFNMYREEISAQRMTGTDEKSIPPIETSSDKLFTAELLKAAGELSIKKGKEFLSIDQERLKGREERLSLKENDLIVTREKSGTIINIGEKSGFLMGKNSTLHIKKLREKHKVFELRHGEIFAVVNKQSPDQIFCVRTPTSICEIVGTEFLLKVFENSKGILATSLEVFEGTVKIWDIDQPATMVSSGNTYQSAVPRTSSVTNVKRLSRMSTDLLKQLGITQKQKKIRKKGADADLNSLAPKAPERSAQSEQLMQIERFINNGEYYKAYTGLKRSFNEGWHTQKHLDMINALEKKLVKSGEYRMAVQVLELLEKQDNKILVQNSIIRSAVICRRDLKDAASAAKLYERYKKEFSNGIYDEEVYNNLAEIYGAQKKWKNTYRILLEYYNKYEDGSFMDRILYRAATVAREKLKDNKRAAELYLKYIRKYRTQVKSQDALYWLIVCYKEAGDFPRAQEHIEKYRKGYTDGRWAAEIQKIESEILK
jgi:TolA-binding protein